jgi:hypothetical protein
VRPREASTTALSFTRRGKAANIAAISVVTLLAGALASCGGATRRADQPSSRPSPSTRADRAAETIATPRARAVDSRIAAAVGRSLVIPLAPVDGPPDPQWRPTSAPALTTAANAPIPADLVQFGVSALVPESTSWLTASATWFAMPASSAAPAQPGAPATIAVPTDAAPPGTPRFWALVVQGEHLRARTGLRLDGQSLAVSWADAQPSDIDAARQPRLNASPEAFTALGQMLSGDARDPLRRWRVALLADRIKPAQLVGQRAWPEPLSDPNLEALASHEEWSWRTALAALARADKALAADVKNTITAVIRTPDGVLLPAWRDDDKGLASLRAVLLNVDSTRAQRVAAANAWLTQTPRAIAWVIDESAPHPELVGRADAVEATIAIANLRGTRLSASLAAPGRPAGAAQMIDGHHEALLRVPMRRDPRDDAAPPIIPAVVRIGDVPLERPVRVAPLPVTPPGLALGPTYATWSMPQWMVGVPSIAPPERATAALLRRVGDAWEVYVECRRPAQGEPRAPEADADPQLSGDDVGGEGEGSELTVPPPRDIVRVHLGPSNAPGRVITLSAPPEDQTPWSDRWTARATIPESEIEAGQTLRIGIERIDERGVRTTWPRPVLPGQSLVPRAVIDLTTWGGLDASTSPDDAPASAPGAAPIER